MNLYEDILRIKEVMGLLNEQSISLPIPVGSSFVSYDADSAHKLSELEKELDVLLPQIYNSGINPKITSASMSIVKNNDGSYTTTYKVIVDKSNDGKAWVGFTSRGSINRDYEKRADGQISGEENKDGRSLEQKLTSIGAGEIEYVPGTPIIDRKVPFKQYFVQFTKPKQYPPKQQGTTNTNAGPKKRITITGNDLSSFLTNIKTESQNTSIDPKSVSLTLDSNRYVLSYEPGKTQVSKLVLAINTPNDKQIGSFPSKDNILSKNPGSFVVYEGLFDGNTRNFALIGIL